MLFYSGLSLTWDGLILPTLSAARADLAGIGGANISTVEDTTVKYGFFGGGVAASNGMTTVDRIDRDLTVTRGTALTVGRSQIVTGRCGKNSFFIQGKYNINEGGDSSVEMYNNETGTLARTDTAMVAYCHAGGALATDLVMWGGGVRTASTSPLNGVWWSSGNGTYSATQSLPTAVTQLGYAACGSGQVGFFFGGKRSDNTLVATVSMYSPATTRTPADSLSAGTYGCLGATTPNYAYHFGGFQDKGIDRWNKNGTRQTLTNIDQQYHAFGAAIGCGPWAMAIGGEDVFENTISQITYCNDDGTVAIMNMIDSSGNPLKLERHAVLTLGNQIIIAGGTKNSYDGTRQTAMYLMTAEY